MELLSAGSMAISGSAEGRGSGVVDGADDIAGRKTRTIT